MCFGRESKEGDGKDQKCNKCPSNSQNTSKWIVKHLKKGFFNVVNKQKYSIFITNLF